MAIIKPFETPQGVSGNYHKILKAEMSMTSETVEMTVAVYASAEARSTGKNVLWHEYQTIPFSALTQDPRDLLYPMLSFYGDSFLRGGKTDAEGSGAPGNFEINLKPEAMVPTPAPQEAPAHAPQPVAPPLPPHPPQAKDR